MQFTLSDAISKLVPNSEFVITGNTLEGLVFINPKDTPIPAQSQVHAALAKLQSDFDNAKSTAQAKLEALGLTADDLKALGL